VSDAGADDANSDEERIIQEKIQNAIHLSLEDCLFCSDKFPDFQRYVLQLY
jgi:hypothetical protein